MQALGCGWTVNFVLLRAKFTEHSRCPSSPTFGSSLVFFSRLGKVLNIRFNVLSFQASAKGDKCLNVPGLLYSSFRQETLVRSLATAKAGKTGGKCV